MTPYNNITILLECICGLAAAVTDLLQSVELEYNGYQGEGTDSAKAKKGATQQQVTDHLNGLFSLVQGLGGTSVVRTYIDQLAQVLSALVGWSKIEKCWNGSSTCKNSSNKEHHGKDKCEYLLEVKRDDRSCDKCECMKWKESNPGIEGVSVGRGCKKCDGDNCGKAAGGGCTCQCNPDGNTCTGDCKCDRKCGCTNGTYRSAYGERVSYQSYIGESHQLERPPNWQYLSRTPTAATTNGISKQDGLTPSQRRHQCAQILLGSVCLIWSGITYMYWTGKWANGSPYWNNHILDGSGLDDGTLSQWLQALGFPKEMLNDAGPGNRMDAVIWDGFRDKFFLGFLEPSGLGHDVKDENGNTARAPFGMNYPGFVHTIHRDSFNEDATVFKKDSGSSITETSQHKNGAIFKLYIVSCAYFTGLQKKTAALSTTNNNTPRTIREVLYWLSALPYSQAYKEMLDYGKGRLKEVLKKPGETESSTDKTPKLSFLQQGRDHPITVDEYNLFAHFQAVTQYCPLVLIGIQGGLKGADSTKEPPIHSLYANSHFSFTYPTVPIQAYNQVVHYIRGLFYQLYFLRKQCAVKVTCGGKWRECRYGKDVVSKGVISWMCLGCDPMEHDRKKRVDKVKVGLKTVSSGKSEELVKNLKTLLEKIGEVVVQLGNAQEALEKKEQKAIEGVKKELEKAKGALEKVKDLNGLNDKLGEAKKALDDLTDGGKGALHTLVNSGNGSLQQITSAGADWQKKYSDAKNEVTKAINKVLEVLTALKEGVKIEEVKKKLNNHEKKVHDSIYNLLDIVGPTRCVHCKDHSNKCGRRGEKKTCDKCHQQYMDGTPSPLQAFLEDRLPGFSCNNTMELLDKWEESNPGGTPSSDQYPSAASHLGHCGGSGQCCPLPMGFRNNFYKGSTNDCTGARLYGILYFFSNGDMMQSCVYTLVRVTAELSATTPQVLGDVFGFFRGGVGEKERGNNKSGRETACGHTKDPSTKGDNDYFCGWCASGLRDEVQKIEWIYNGTEAGGHYMEKVGKALINIKGDKGTGGAIAYAGTATTTTSNLSTLTDNNHYVSPLTGELYTAVSATFGGTYLSWVLYLSDALEGGLQSLASAFKEIECRGCRECDPNKCKKGSHGNNGEAQCRCDSVVSCTGVLPVLYRHGFSYGNPFNLEGYHQKDGKTEGDYSIDDKGGKKHCHEFLDAINAVIDKNNQKATTQDNEHPLTNLLSEVGKLQYDIRLPWIFVLTVAWLVAVLYLAFGAIWPLDWTHMRSHWLRGGEHQWQCMWYKVMTGRKGVELMEYFGRQRV